MDRTGAAAMAIGMLLSFFIGIWGGFAFGLVDFATGCEKGGHYELHHTFLLPVSYECKRKP